MIDRWWKKLVAKPEPDMELTPEYLAKAAYHAYAQGVGGRSAVRHDLLPAWEKCLPLVQTGWIHAARAVTVLITDNLAVQSKRQAESYRKAFATKTGD